MKLEKLTEAQAEAEFKKGNVVYIQHVDGHLEPETSANTLFICQDKRDANLNIYLGQRPLRSVGFSEYLEFIQERTQEPIKFFTYHSKEALII